MATGFPIVTDSSENPHSEYAPPIGAHLAGADGPASGPALEVFWRPGCPYCSALRWTLSRHEVPATWRNIWTDESARSFVRSVNAGDETVPTVRIGERTLTNPSWAQLDKLLGDGPWRHQGRRASPTRVIASWLPVVALILAGIVLIAGGHSRIGWGSGVLAVALWWLSRPLRR